MNKHLANLLLNYSKLIRKGRRQFLGFPGNGQKTRSNGRKANINNKKLIKLFIHIYKKYDNIVYHTSLNIILRAQIINYLWYSMWPLEWKEAQIKSYFLKPKKLKKLYYNLEKASSGQGVGYTRTGKAATRGKARTKLTYTSIGMPINLIKAFITHNTKKYKFHVTTK